MPHRSLKGRVVTVYLPSEEMLEDWRSQAEAGGVSLSKFIIERVMDSVNRERDYSYMSRLRLIEKVRELEDENARLREEVKVLKMALDNLERELRLYRSKPFLEKGFAGVRKMDRELIDLLKRGKPVNEDAILRELKIRPAEIEAISAVRKQLEILESYGLVELTERGWVWKG